MSSLPHFRGILIQTGQENEVRAQAKVLSETAGSKPLFLLSPYAGFYYLVSGLRNPTPFDYPRVMTLGSNGEAEVIAAISTQQIQSLCLDDDGAVTLVLEDYVRRQMTPIRDLGFCTLYRARP